MYSTASLIIFLITLIQGHKPPPHQYIYNTFNKICNFPLPRARIVTSVNIFYSIIYKIINRPKSKNETLLHKYNLHKYNLHKYNLHKFCDIIYKEGLMPQPCLIPLLHGTNWILVSLLARHKITYLYILFI
jgi:hypothetical protein